LPELIFGLPSGSFDLRDLAPHDRATQIKHARELSAHALPGLLHQWNDERMRCGIVCQG
jgi:hypothetical protein